MSLGYNKDLSFFCLDSVETESRVGMILNKQKHSKWPFDFRYLIPYIRFCASTGGDKPLLPSLPPPLPLFLFPDKQM